jgi:uncharacterized membrane protein
MRQTSQKTSQVIITTGILLVALVQTAAAESIVTTFPSLLNSKAVGVSADGSAVLITTVASTAPAASYIWTPQSGLHVLGFSPGNSSISAAAISADGSVVVETQANYAYVWNSSSGLQPLGGGAAGFVSPDAVVGVSNDGSVITGTMAVGGLDAYRYTAQSGFQNLGTAAPPGNTGLGSRAIGMSGDGSVIIGYVPLSTFDPAYGFDAPFRWTATGGMTILSGLSGQVDAISRDGSTIVGFGSGGVFKLTAAGEQVLGGVAPPTGVSADGSVILGFGATGYYDPNGIDLPVSPGVPLAISDDDRTVVGYTTNRDGSTTAFISTLVVPEPSTLVLAILGLAALLAYRWRR